MATSIAEAVYRRDRAIVLAALAGVTLLAWGYMYVGAGGHAMGPHTAEWRLADLVTAFLMWNVMMVGMMIPTASPMILTFATTNRRQRERQGTYVPTAFFVLGYVLVWSGYSAAATLSQWGLQSASLLSPHLLQTTPLVGGLVLIGAGLFQFSKLKYACLTHCRTPLSFLASEWREGAGGALAMGLRHGAYCVGCCWAIMAAMFVVGIMNLLWTAALAVFMLVEKVAPAGDRIGRVAGVLFIIAGSVLILRSPPL